jgi:hypothetical protein
MQHTLPLPLLSSADRTWIRQAIVHAREASFKGGLSAPIHQWFRLTPSFGPSLVQIMLRSMETLQGATVLDPFAGAGTTLIEAKLHGYPSYGFELNPMLAFASTTSLIWDLSIEDLLEAREAISEGYTTYKRNYANESLASLGLTVPPIHNVERWWRADVLKDLLYLLKLIGQVSRASKKIRDFLELCFAGVLVPDLTNVHLGRLQLHFTNKDGVPMDVWRVYSSHLDKMISDIRCIDEQQLSTEARVWNINSVSGPLPILPRKVDRIITSPPYPNRYSYVWNTRPHMYMLGHITTGKEATDIDKAAIGGTWGSATSVLSKGTWKPKDGITEVLLSPTIAALRRGGDLMANYVLKYFDDLAKHIRLMATVLEPGGKAAYVVGCTEIKGVYVETDVLLGHLFEGLNLGFRVDSIDRFRKRNSGQDLHESIVYTSFC